MNNKSNLKSMFGLLVLALLPASGTNAQSWNTAEDFSAVNNPNGVWQYGYEATLGEAFVLFDVRTNRESGLDYWISSLLGLDPDVSHNPSSSPVAGPSDDFVLGPNSTAFHPGPNGEFGIFRWTAPTAGLFSIHADFVGLGMRSTTDLHVLVDGVPVFSDAINGPGMTAAFDTLQPLVSGSTVDFAVGFGNGNYMSDTTGINATIAVVPESSSLALVAAGGLTVAGSVATCRKTNPRTGRCLRQGVGSKSDNA
jgi:hypothetical protein